MGINPTPFSYKSFTFDGKSTREFGVYITGEGVFNAPERAVEMISIPGRDGEYALDQGHFKNIEVTYRAGIVSYDTEDFAEAISNFRNWLASRKGYCRLTDEYNPDEYRMAVFKNVITVDHEGLETGEFDITFNCKPQRWLTEGETPITIGEWGETETYSGEIVSFEATDSDAVKALTVDIVPVQSGSGTPSPDNVRPISGSASVTVYDTDEQYYSPSNTVIGKNWINGNDEKRAINKFNIVGGETYKVYTKGGNFFKILFIQMNGTSQITNGSIVSPTNENVTLDANCNNIIIQFEKATAITADDFNDFVCSVSKQLTTTTTQLGQTVYGGTLDVVSGVLTVDRVSVTIDGNTAIQTNGAVGSVSKFFYYAPNKAFGTNNMISDTFTVGNTPLFGEMWGRAGNNGVEFNLPASVPQTVADGQAWFSNNPTQIVYPLATPTTTQLTPQQIALLLGENNIFADSGNVTVEVGQNPSVLINPTQFDSEPLLAVDGYGTIGFNGFEIEINNEVMGDVIVAEADDVYRPTARTITIQADRLNTSDTFVVNAEFVIQHTKTSANQVINITLGTATGCSAVYSRPNTVNVVMNSATFTKGTSATATCSIAYSAETTNTGTKSCTQTCTVTYNGTDTLTFSMSGTNITNTTNKRSARHGAIYGDSTVSVLGNPTYIDCDIGEAYMETGGSIVSLNQYIDLGSDLPTLPPGTTEITFDNTVTELKIMPRWWKV